MGRVACLVAAILVALPAANGADLQVPVSIAMRGAVAEVAARFEKQTGNTVKIIAAAPSQIVASDRKSTRLNSSHTVISYAVFCLKKKKKKKHIITKRISYINTIWHY